MIDDDAPLSPALVGTILVGLMVGAALALTAAVLLIS